MRLARLVGLLLALPAAPLAAKALGLTIPRSVLARADEIIQ